MTLGVLATFFCAGALIAAGASADLDGQIHPDRHAVVLTGPDTDAGHDSDVDPPARGECIRFAFMPRRAAALLLPSATDFSSHAFRPSSPRSPPSLRAS